MIFVFVKRRNIQTGLTKKSIPSINFWDKIGMIRTFYFRLISLFTVSRWKISTCQVLYLIASDEVKDMHQYTLNNWSNLPLKLPWSGEKISVQFNIQYRSLPWPTLACVIDNNLEENEKTNFTKKLFTYTCSTSSFVIIYSASRKIVQ